MHTTTIIMAANTITIMRNNTLNNKQSNTLNNKQSNKLNNKTNNIDWGVYGAALGLLFGFLTFSFNLVFFQNQKF
ncbi:hypothetical protein [Helicobacter pylori]|uniref:hypothetical protein n=1 Tax=Helicobacter pylori TaxID=210 RepID=UPI00214BAA1C|nr:hypothetical protein [Helicobacter pylori]